MSKEELADALNQVEAALQVFHRHEGQLSAQEISVKSMLLAVRSDLSHQLLRDGSTPFLTVVPSAESQAAWKTPN